MPPPSLHVLDPNDKLSQSAKQDGVGLLWREVGSLRHRVESRDDLYHMATLDVRETGQLRCQCLRSPVRSHLPSRFILFQWRFITCAGEFPDRVVMHATLEREQFWVLREPRVRDIRQGPFRIASRPHWGKLGVPRG